jgi:hypothetical protein
MGAAGMTALTLLDAYSFGSVAGWLLLVGAGIGVSTGPSQASALSAVEPGVSATASAMMSLLRYIGGITGTTILSVALGESATDLARHHVALWVFTAAFLASALCATRLTSLNLESSR